jgi:hypothetical protein
VAQAPEEEFAAIQQAEAELGRNQDSISKTTI